MWSSKEHTFDDLFPIDIVIIPNLNRIMQNPIMILIPVIWPILKNHLGVILFDTLVQQWNETRWNGWFGLKNGRYVNQHWLGNMAQIKFRFESQFGFKSWVQIKELEFTFIFQQWNVIIQNRWFSFKIYGYMNQCCSGIGSKSGKDTEVNIDLKFETESQSWGSGSLSHLSSISLKWKFANLFKVWD